MRILVAHNAYLYRGGEDTVVESEIALLRRHGHEVMLYRRDNTELDALPRWQAAMDSVWSKRTVMEVGRLLGSFRPHLIHAHNTFPLISPSLYGVADELGIPVVQTLHNFRLLCPQAMLMRNGRYCDDCVGGTPVIASRHGGLREIIEHGHNGLLVTPGNADELADAIAYAVSNPIQMRRMGLEAYQTYLARYTPERNYTTLMTIYHQTLAPLPTSLTAETIDA